VTPSARKRLFSAAGTAAVLAALAALNLLSVFVHARLDFSAGRSFSLSAGTKAALDGLTQPLVVEVFFTRGLPPPFSLNERYLRDLLEEYRAAGRGRVTVRWSDPDRDPDALRRAREAGVAPVQVNTAGGGVFQAKEALMGVALLSGGREETLPVVDQANDLEYQLTRRIRALSGERRRVVGFSTGHGERAPGDPQLEGFFKELGEAVEPRAVRLDRLPGDLDALWIVGPSSRLSPAERDAAAAFAASGKTLAVLSGTRLADFARFQSSPVDAGLSPLLARWGVSLGEGLVTDLQAERVQLQVPAGRMSTMQVVPYPYIPLATRLDRGHPALAGLEAVPFPYCSPVRFDPAKAGGASYRSLADSSHASWLADKGDVSPARGAEDLRDGRPGPFSLAGAAEGPQGRLLVVGTGYQLDPRVAGQPPVKAFLLNMIEWSAADPALLTLRGKGLVFRPLRPLPAPLQGALRWLLALTLPFSTACGVAAWHWERARRRRALPSLYAEL
jgi:ABC-type uncharacterized transport system involved in gliding motility auxiliary subunit